jgi:hypothetical protein
VDVACESATSTSSSSAPVHTLSTVHHSLAALCFRALLARRVIAVPPVDVGASPLVGFLPVLLTVTIVCVCMCFSVSDCACVLGVGVVCGEKVSVLIVFRREAHYCEVFEVY